MGHQRGGSRAPAPLTCSTFVPCGQHTLSSASATLQLACVNLPRNARSVFSRRHWAQVGEPRGRGVAQLVQLPMGKYWGVTHVKRRGAWTWLAQRCRGGQRLWRCGFSSEDVAAAWLAKQLGVSTASLRKSGESLVITSSFKGVVPRRSSSRCAIRWIAQDGQKHLGIYASEETAAEALARARGVPVSELGRKRRRGASGRGVVGQISVGRARAGFKAAHAEFKTYMAGDYQSMLKIESSHARDFKKDSFWIVYLRFSLFSTRIASLSCLGLVSDLSCVV